MSNILIGLGIVVIAVTVWGYYLFKDREEDDEIEYYESGYQDDTKDL